MVNGIKVGIWYFNRIVKYIITLIKHLLRNLDYISCYSIASDKQLPVIGAEKLPSSFDIPILNTWNIELLQFACNSQKNIWCELFLKSTLAFYGNKARM